jgi:hypothetical protein
MPRIVLLASASIDNWLPPAIFIGGFVLFIGFVAFFADYTSPQKRFAREDRAQEKQRNAARWRAVSDVVRRYNPETETLGEPAIYELKIVLETPKGIALKAVELWRYDMTDPEFVNLRGVKLGEARAMAEDLNSELEKVE